MTQTMLDRRKLLGTLMALPSLAHSEPVTGRCRFRAQGGEETGAERGFFEVPEDRLDPNSRLIRLGYVRFPCKTPKAGPPIVYLAGGPGAAGTAAAAGPRFHIFQALREVADVIAFDQRGTGISNQIPPAAFTTRPLPPLTREGLTSHIRSEFRRAWEAWTAQGVAMRGYNTVESADDIEDLRRHLKAEVIDLWGISYGSHLALAVLKRHGRGVRRVALASLEGQDQTVKRPARTDAYLRRVDALLSADAEIRREIPDLLALMRGVHARLDSEPAELTVSHEGASRTVTVGTFAIQLLVGKFIASPAGLAQMPSLYRRLHAGEMQALAPFLAEPSVLLTVSGMPEAMDLASGISPERLALVQSEAEGAVLGDSLNFPMPHLLGVVSGVDLGPTFRAPIRIDHPALLVAGSLDGRTPLEEQAEVAEQFRRRTTVVVENAGHNVFEAHPQVQSMLVEFFRSGTPRSAKLSLPPPRFRLG